MNVSGRLGCGQGVRCPVHHVGSNGREPDPPAKAAAATAVTAADEAVPEAMAVSAGSGQASGTAGSQSAACLCSSDCRPWWPAQTALRGAPWVSPGSSGTTRLPPRCRMRSGTPCPPLRPCPTPGTPKCPGPARPASL
eukprot:7387296-Prymnesium_polylepis.1